MQIIARRAARAVAHLRKRPEWIQRVVWFRPSTPYQETSWVFGIHHKQPKQRRYARRHNYSLLVKPAKEKPIALSSTLNRSIFLLAKEALEKRIVDSLLVLCLTTCDIFIGWSSCRWRQSQRIVTVSNYYLWGHPY